MSKYISAAFFRDVVSRQRFGGEDEGISFDYMLELIEQEIIKNYENRDNRHPHPLPSMPADNPTD